MRLRSNSSRSNNNITVDVSLREFDISDIKEMVRIDALCFPPAQKFDEEIFNYYLYALPSISLVIEDSSNNLIGFIIFSRIKKTVWELVTIDIEPSFQGKKLGRLLIREGLERVEEYKPRRITLHVQVDNERAINLYKGHNFFIVNKIDNYYNDDKDAYLMYKEYEND